MEHAFPEFLLSNAVRPQVDSFCGIKNTQNRSGPELRPGPHWVSLHHSPDPLAGGEGASCPLLKNHTPRLGPSDLAPPCLLTFDYHPPLLPVNLSQLLLPSCFLKKNLLE